MHETAHSTLSATRLDWKEALAWRRLCHGIAASRDLLSDVGRRGRGLLAQAHIDNHAAHLKSWIKGLSADTIAIFSASKDAAKMADYTIGLERQMMLETQRGALVADYDRYH